MEKLHAILLVKSKSNRLPGKNIIDFKGKPMFLWNVEKCLKIFDEVYVSSDSDYIIDLAERNGAIGIKRGEELCGDVPDIPVYQHALNYMSPCDGIVAVHANNPNIKRNLIALTKKCLEMGVDEVMTCRAIKGDPNYHRQSHEIYGSIRGISKRRLEDYGDPYKPKPDMLFVDNSIEIETLEDYNKALNE